ncbi:MAG: hypothetical protein IT379_24600 [Deltaproteobacteria bacterium]|nr:hypothetical protein [Deltaproteobacteria bacterium]
MSTTGDAVLAGIETVVETIAVSVSGMFGVVTVGTVDDNADEITTPRRTHVVPTGDRRDTEGGGCCTRILTFDVTGHWPRTPAGIKQMVTDVKVYEDKLRRIDLALADLDEGAIADTRWPRIEQGADFGYSDVATATWRMSLYYVVAAGGG